MQVLLATAEDSATNWSATGGTTPTVLADDSDSTYVATTDASNSLTVTIAAPPYTPGTGNLRIRARVLGPGSLTCTLKETITTVQAMTLYSSIPGRIEDLYGILTIQPTAWTDLHLVLSGSHSGFRLIELSVDVPDGVKDPSDPKRKRGGKFFDRKRWL